MRTFLFVIILFAASTLHAEAHVPVLVSQESLFDIDTIEDPELSQAMYGEMKGFPHTFEIRTDKPFMLFVQILSPDIPGSVETLSGVIIKEPEGGGRVEEIGVLNATDAQWEREFERFGGDYYKNGPSVEKNVGPGIYRIEVHTLDNLEKYVLVVGKREEMTLGYFELVRRIAAVKVFFGKSQFRVIESPLVYVPALVVSVVVFGAWFMYRKKVRRSRV